MKVLVFGGRDFGNPNAPGKKIEQARKEYRFVLEVLDMAHGHDPISLIISGGATGADSVAVDWAKKRGVPFKVYEARWDDVEREGAVVRKRRDGKLYDAAAGGLRNQEMIDDGKPEMAIGFPGGAGTADMARRLYRAGIKGWIMKPGQSLDTPDDLHEYKRTNANGGRRGAQGDVQQDQRGSRLG